MDWIFTYPRVFDVSGRGRSTPGTRGSFSPPVHRRFSAGDQALSHVESEAQWKAATDASPVHDAGAETAGKARAAFAGNPALIREVKALLEHRKEFKPVTVRQLERALLIAAEGPM